MMSMAEARHGNLADIAVHPVEVSSIIDSQPDG